MYNKSGFTKETLVNTKQILFNTHMQASVGCIVPTSLATNGIVKAGTPINIDLDSLSTPVKAVDLESSPKVGMNAVLLHDVVITGTGDTATGNGTALIFGFVNKNRLDSAVVTKIEAAAADATASPLLVFAEV